MDTRELRHDETKNDSAIDRLVTTYVISGPEMPPLPDIGAARLPDHPLGPVLARTLFAILDHQDDSPDAEIDPALNEAVNMLAALSTALLARANRVQP